MAKNSKKINETLSKSDVSKEVKVYMDSNDFKKKIEKIVKDRLKNEKELNLNSDNSDL
jgi:hypothetical protein